MPGSILLADDEEKILKTLGRALRDDGHEVMTAPNAKEASRLLSERSFDLLIIDFLMPDRTGLDVIRDLAANTPETERPAIVMMTAPHDTGTQKLRCSLPAISPVERVDISASSPVVFQRA